MNVTLIAKNVAQIKNGISISVTVKIQKNIAKNLYLESCKNGKYNDSVVIWDEIIKETKTVPTKTAST